MTVAVTVGHFVLRTVLWLVSLASDIVSYSRIVLAKHTVRCYTLVTLWGVWWFPVQVNGHMLV